MSEVNMYTVIVTDGGEVIDKFVVHRNDYDDHLFESIDIFDCNADCLNKAHEEEA